MKKIAATLFAGAAAAAMLAAPAAAENLSFYNSTSNWEAALHDAYGGTWTCVKTEVDNGMSAVDSDADIVVVKGGNVVPAFGPDVTQAPINPRTGMPFGISWYMECNSDDEPPSDPPS